MKIKNSYPIIICNNQSCKGISGAFKNIYVVMLLEQVGTLNTF